MVQSIPPGPFFIVSKLNGRVIDVNGASTKDGAKIIVWSKKESDNDNQLWEYRHGFFVNVHSGKVLDVKGGDVESNAVIIQYERKDISQAQENQVWLIDHSGFIHTGANPNLVLDIKGGDDEDGAEIILFEKKEGSVASNQQWDLVPAGAINISGY